MRECTLEAENLGYDKVVKARNYKREKEITKLKIQVDFRALQLAVFDRREWLGNNRWLVDYTIMIPVNRYDPQLCDCLAFLRVKTVA